MHRTVLHGSGTNRIGRAPEVTAHEEVSHDQAHEECHQTATHAAKLSMRVILKEGT